MKRYKLNNKLTISIINFLWWFWMLGFKMLHCTDLNCITLSSSCIWCTCNCRTGDVQTLTLLLSVLLLFPGCPAGGALSPRSPAPLLPHICPPWTSASNPSEALPSTCPPPPPLLYTTSGSTHQWATPIRLAKPHRKPIQPMRRRSFLKPATQRMKRKAGSSSGS